jgi:two-component system response regulator AtoC
VNAQRPVAEVRPLRILVVEDDAALAELFIQIFHERGHAIDRADDVASAVAVLVSEPFDVVLADLRLPGASGLELLAWVRRHRPSTRVILASAFVTRELATHARTLGAREVLSKPIEPTALVAAVEEAAWG